MKILIAEDELTIGDNYKLMLESRNHEVTLTQDGAQCLLIFKKAFHEVRSRSSDDNDSAPFDIVVLDERMPNIGGVDVAKQILAICPKQKIIFATAHTMDTLDGIREKINLGIEVLQKPFDLDAFVEMIEDFGQRKSVAHQEAS